MKSLSGFLLGLLFGVGLVISGMSDPAKVLNFLDLFGTWDPSLAFVMGGALAVAAVIYRQVFRAPKPILGTTFHVPTGRVIDRRLIAGSATFGVGWGLSGFCPGGAIPALGTGRAEVVIFFAAMAGGIALSRLYLTRRAAPAAVA